MSNANQHESVATGFGQKAEIVLPQVLAKHLGSREGSGPFRRHGDSLSGIGKERRSRKVARSLARSRSPY